MNEERTLGEQLQYETRICMQCGYIVLFPMVERCPRCYGLLPKLDLTCNGCVHNSSCPVKDIKAFETNEEKI
ncbi:MAG TPA: hypothetical protein VII11_12055 [Bacteroidota bacterium]